ncbi:RimJ/RimL family protein N-acetyltransferase [Virgibacillus halotolerans]|uniref:GNAT family N-acetyltransferase n=1 Tax=Virgibacillus halotolerans TaxID=1071053 RepID=UPI001961B8FE|nr:GNAT family N-acetyltransferase [Virgibacillus halotolerans]MBM7601667.1 RimJ/RimL family protein N-acetyltransferase [Virgibacillus halotolerans]
MLSILQTDRLILRSYKVSDAPTAQKLAGERGLAETTFLPHPYTLEAAKEWIQGHSKLIEAGSAYPFAVTMESTKELIGTMTIRVDKLHNKGELAYWIGRPYWGKGYATEAAQLIIDFGFNELNLNRIWAPIMSKNKASCKVMEKVGMSYEGTIKQDILRWGQYEDVDIYGLLKANDV